MQVPPIFIELPLDDQVKTFANSRLRVTFRFFRKIASVTVMI